MKIKTKKLTTLLSTLVALSIALKPAFAYSEKKAFVLYNTDKQEISQAIDEYIQQKSKAIYRENIEGGFFHYQPKYFLTSSENYYIILGVKEEDSKTYLYIENDVFCSDKKDELIKHLRKQGFRAAPVKDAGIVSELNTYTITRMNTYKSVKKAVAKTSKKKESQNLPETKTHEVKGNNNVKPQLAITPKPETYKEPLNEIIEPDRQEQLKPVQKHETVDKTVNDFTKEKPKEQEAVTENQAEAEVYQEPQVTPKENIAISENHSEIPAQEKQTPVQNQEKLVSKPLIKDRNIVQEPSIKQDALAESEHKITVYKKGFNPLPIANSGVAKINAKRQISQAGQIYNTVSNGVVTVLTSGHGSGFLAYKSGNNGLILTNFHVIKEQNGFIKVRFSHGQVVKAKIMATDIENDVAVLWVNLKNIKNYDVLKMFNTENGEPLAIFGEKVISIGSPIEYATMEKTLTHGLISKLNNDLIWHDSPINHGNSGGPLLNYNCEVIGINTFLENAEGRNLSIAISIDKAYSLLKKVKGSFDFMSAPSAELIPDVDMTSYNYDIMEQAYFKYSEQSLKDRKRTEPYLVKTASYDIYIITPPQLYRKIANSELEETKRLKKRMEKSGKELAKESFISKTFSNHEYNKPVVTAIIMPQTSVVKTSVVKNLTKNALGVILTLKFKSIKILPVNNIDFQYEKDFAKLRLIDVNTRDKIEPIRSGKELLSNTYLQDSGVSENLSIDDRSYIGIYEFDPKVFNTDKEIAFEVYSMDGSEPIFVKINKNIKSYIKADFVPFWDNLNSKNKL